MNDKSPTDILCAVEAIASQEGQSQSVDEEYYADFLSLSREEIQRLALMLMVAQEAEIRRIAQGTTDGDSSSRVFRLVRNTLEAVSLGMAGFDPFGLLVVTARMGLEPEPATQESLDQFYRDVEFLIDDLIRQELPRMLARRSNQEELPL